MITKLSDFFNRFANGRNVLLFFVLQILFNIVVFPCFMVKSATGQSLPVLDLMFGFTPERAYEVLTAYGEKGRETTLFIGSVVDTIYPVVYTLFNIFAISYFFKKAFPENSKWRMLNLFAIFPMIFDLMENRGIATMIHSYPEQNYSAAYFASISNQLKWSFETIAILLILIGMAGAIINRNKKIK